MTPLQTQKNLNNWQCPPCVSVAIVKRRGTHGGFIDYNGCIFVTDEVIHIPEESGLSAEPDEYTLAYSVAALILINLVKLAGAADDSARSITEARGYE